MLTDAQVAALDRIARTADQLRMGEGVLRAQVNAARAAGASWSSIARMLRCSKQAAAQKYERRRSQGTANGQYVGINDRGVLF